MDLLLFIKGRDTPVQLIPLDCLSRREKDLAESRKAIIHARKQGAIAYTRNGLCAQDFRAHFGELFPLIYIGIGF